MLIVERARILLCEHIASPKHQTVRSVQRKSNDGNGNDGKNEINNKFRFGNLLEHVTVGLMDSINLSLSSKGIISLWATASYVHLLSLRGRLVDRKEAPGFGLNLDVDD